MSENRPFIVKLVESSRTFPPEEARDGVTLADLEVTPAPALDAFKATAQPTRC